MDRFKITAARMAAGEAVGEGYLYGSDAIELGARGLVDAGTMTRYRSAAFFARKNIYGHEQALKWESDAKAGHEAACAVHHSRKATV